MMRTFIFGFILVFVWACGDNSSVLPKPRIYPRVIYPDKNYKLQTFQDCPFGMMIPEYFVSIQDTFSEEGSKNKCWFDLYSQNFDAYLHLSYIDIDNRKHFDKLMSDAFELADKHNIKASFRDEIKISKPENDLHGILFEIEGPVATPLQFFVTDSTNHFMRGSLYFKSQVNRDSIAPIYEFLREDIVALLDSYSWK
jgi:gliding motility-associated lipoprotein GldD